MDSMIAGGCETCTKDKITCGLWESPTWAGVNMCKQPLALALPSFGFVGADAIIEAFKLEDVTPTGGASAHARHTATSRHHHHRPC